jgi:hypothetical protein
MTFVIFHRWWLLSISIVITEVSFCWWIVHISHHAHICFVLPDQCCVITSGCHSNVILTLVLDFSSPNPVSYPSCLVWQSVPQYILQIPCLQIPQLRGFYAKPKILVEGIDWMTNESSTVSGICLSKCSGKVDTEFENYYWHTKWWGNF